MRFTNRRKSHIEGPKHTIFNPKRIHNKKFRARRTLIFCITIVTLLFISKILIGFFNINQVTFALFGNLHYTEGQVFDVLGDNLDNIITDSERKTVKYLKENLSYIEQAKVTKNIAKRLLTIEITERKAFARVKFILLEDRSTGITNSGNKGRSTEHLFLIDDDGYVLEYIKPMQFNHMVLILDEGEEIPEIGNQNNSHATQLGIRILGNINTKERILARHLNYIDARETQKIVIDIERIPLTVWISEDLIEIGLHHVALFVQHNIQAILHNQQTISDINNIKKRTDANGKQAQQKYTYLDARYEDTLYLGGSTK